MARIRRRWRWLIRATLALLAVAAGSYAYLTRPAALEAAVDRALAVAGLEIAGTRAVSYSPFAGLTLTDVTLRPIGTGGAADSHDTDILIARVRVRVSPLSLVRGGMAAQRIELDNPQLRLTRATLTRQVDRWFGGGASPAAQRHWPVDLPELVIRRADLQICEGENRGPQLVRRWILSGSGGTFRADAVARGPTGYELTLEQVAGPASGSTSGQAGPFLVLSITPKLLRASVGLIELDTLAALAPADAAARMRRLELQGRVRAEFESSDRGLHLMRIGLADVAGAIPFEGADYRGPAFLKLSQVTGTVEVRPTAMPVTAPANSWDVAFEVRGRANEGQLSVSAQMQQVHAQAQPDAPGAQVGSDTWRAIGGTLAVEVSGLRLPELPRHEAFICAPHMPPAVREFFRDYVPSGQIHAQVAVNVERDSAEADSAWRVRWAGFAEPLGASCRYHRFPYDFDDARGRVRFSNDGIVIEGLTGTHGSGQIRMRGRLDNSFKWTGFDLHFDAVNVPLNQDLFAALPDTQKRVWAKADPVGLTDLTVHLSRPNGSPETGPAEPTLDIDAELLAVNLTLPGARRMTQARGRLTVRDDRLRLHDLTGFLDDAAVQLSGPIELADGGADTGERVRVEACNFPVHHQTTLRDEQKRPVGALRFDGVADVWGSVDSAGSGIDDQFVLRLRDGALYGFAGARGWRGARGWVFADGAGYRVLDFSAGQEGRRIAASGRLSGTQEAAAPLEVELEVTDSSLSELLNQMVPQRWGKLRTALGLDGAGRVRLSLSESPATGMAARIELQAERMVPTAMPLQFRTVGAGLTLREDGFELHEATAYCGEEASVRLSGDGDWTQQQSWSRFRVDAKSLRLDDTFIEALPTGLARLLRKLEARGRLDVELDRVRIVERPHPEWDVSGTARLRDAELMLGLDLRDFDGELRGAVAQDPAGRLAIAATFGITRGRLAGRTLTDAQGELRLEPGSEWVLLSRLNTRVCDGTAVGDARVHIDTAQYELSLTLQNVRLDQLLGGGDRASARPGRVDGRVFLRGAGRDPAARRGGGELLIREASLLSTPVTRSVAQASAERNRPISEGVEEARLRFAWEGTRLDFTRVDIRTRDIRLIGTGYWDAADDSVSLELLAAGPDDSLRVPILTELLERAGQELLQFRVSGKAATPRVTVEPLHNLTEPLRRALAGEE